MNKKSKNVNDGITTLRINRLRGSMLRLPARSSRQEILLVYDLHMDLESVQFFAKKLTRFGNVTALDLPGFGGMDSFYKIGRRANFENYAAYLASFVKLRYKSRRFTIVGLGVGGTLAVQALQRYPDVAAKTNKVLLMGSLVERSDRTMGAPRRVLARVGCTLLMLRPISFICRIALRGLLLNVALGLVRFSSPPQNKAELAEQDRLWRGDDLRSHLSLQKELLSATIMSKRLDLPAFAVAVNTPTDFDYAAWNEHLKVIFADATVTRSRRRLSVTPHDLFSQLPPEAIKFLRQ